MQGREKRVLIRHVNVLAIKDIFIVDKEVEDAISHVLFQEY